MTFGGLWMKNKHISDAPLVISVQPAAIRGENRVKIPQLPMWRLVDPEQMKASSDLGQLMCGHLLGKPAGSR